jgi:hypothetical protein
MVDWLVWGMHAVAALLRSEYLIVLLLLLLLVVVCCVLLLLLLVQVLHAIKYAARHPTVVTVPEQRYLLAAEATGEPAILIAVQEFLDEQIPTVQHAAAAAVHVAMMGAAGGGGTAGPAMTPRQPQQRQPQAPAPAPSSRSPPVRAV